MAKTQNAKSILLRLVQKALEANKSFGPAVNFVQVRLFWNQQNIIFHLLYIDTHVPDWMEAHGSLGLFSEQSLEAYGQRLKRAFNDQG